MGGGQANYDFFTKCQESAKPLRQAVGKRANQVDLGRLGFQLGANGEARWCYPRTFEMATEAGYWGSAIAPKMDETIEQEGVSTACYRILGTLPKKTGPEQTIPKGKAKTKTNATTGKSGRRQEIRWEANQPTKPHKRTAD